MRILLTANASYAPPRGGATRSNLLWLEHLAAAGHACRIVAAGLPESASKREQIAAEIIDWYWCARQDGVNLLKRGSIRLYEVTERGRQPWVLHRQIHEFQPDWVLVSSEDLGHVLLGEAARSAPGRIVYLAHTPQFFPFGPASWNPDADAAALVARAAGVVAIGQHTAAYIRQNVGRDAAVIHPPIYGSGPFPNLASFDRGLITMVNPCAIKGISIFLALAAHFRDHGFGVLPGWGTTSADRDQLTQHPNIVTLPNCRQIGQFLSRTRVLVMPSLWHEGFGLTVVEAMLHGVPVVASDAGGLREAKLGTPFVAPVRAIQRYQPVFDEHALPQPVIEPPDLRPWVEALDALSNSRAFYERVSCASREAARSFVGTLDAGRMVAYLGSLQPGPTIPERPSLAHLSPERRTLLLRKMGVRKS
jgi:glycosyltransferase involved in cell wall biosynthesis